MFRILAGYGQIVLGIACGIVFVVIFVRVMMSIGPNAAAASPGALLFVVLIGGFALRTIGAPVVWGLIRSGQNTIERARKWTEFVRGLDAEPLLAAIYRGDVQKMDALLTQGHDINVRETAFGRSALSSAICLERPELAARLIDRGADVNATDYTGITALMYAVVCGLENTVKELIEAGADVAKKDNEGNTAITAAQSLGHDRIVTILRTPRSPGLSRERTPPPLVSSLADCRIRTVDGAVRILQDRNLDSAVVAELPEGAEVQLGAASYVDGREWLQVTMQNGTAGYVLGPMARGHSRISTAESFSAEA